MVKSKNLILILEELFLFLKRYLEINIKINEVVFMVLFINDLNKEIMSIFEICKVLN